MKSGFKSAVAADIKRVFINALEFADPHTINGVLMNAVLDNDILNERLNATSSQYVEGVFKAQIMVYVAICDLKIRPVIGEIFTLDGDMYLVIDVVENMGMFEITIEANRTI